MNGFCLLSQLTPHDSNLPNSPQPHNQYREGEGPHASWHQASGADFWGKKEAAASEIKDKHWCPQLEILIATKERQR